MGASWVMTTRLRAGSSRTAGRRRGVKRAFAGSPMANAGPRATAFPSSALRWNGHDHGFFMLKDVPEGSSDARRTNWTGVRACAAGRRHDGISVEAREADGLKIKRLAVRPASTFRWQGARSVPVTPLRQGDYDCNGCCGRRGGRSRQRLARSGSRFGEDGRHRKRSVRDDAVAR